MIQQLNRTNAHQPQHRPVKVLQFGSGNFLRGFADWVIDILNEKTDFNGAIDIVQSVSANSDINDQQGLYHLVLQGKLNGKPYRNIRLITSVNRTISAAQNFSEFLRAAENPDLRFIFSNTTETGIKFNTRDSALSSLAESFPGKLTQLLYHRFVHFNGASEKTLIIIPCELIEKNGEVLRTVIQQYIAHWNLPNEFKTWIDKNTFCNTLVDRIVPGFPKETITTLEQETGYHDVLTVAAEPFYFWAIEAPEFVQREFPTQRAGLNHVVFTQDITPYRQRKVRILNGAHTALMPVAYLRGLRTVKEAMDDAYTSAFIRETIAREIIPTLNLPKTELEQFAADVEDRFSNPYIRHELISIALNSISKFQVRILPTLIDYIQIHQSLPKNLVQSLAALLVFYKGTHMGESIPLNDSPDTIKRIQDAWQLNTIQETIETILADQTLWGQDLTRINGLTKATIEAISVS